MELNNRVKSALISSTLDILIPAKNEVLRYRFGMSLINQGIKDVNGMPIDPRLQYLVKEYEDVDHKKALENIIEKSKTNDEVDNNIAAYIVRYGRRPERNIKFIINPLKQS